MARHSLIVARANSSQATDLIGKGISKVRVLPPYRHDNAPLLDTTLPARQCPTARYYLASTIHFTKGGYDARKRGAPSRGWRECYMLAATYRAQVVDTVNPVLEKNLNRDGEGDGDGDGQGGGGQGGSGGGARRGPSRCTPMGGQFRFRPLTRPYARGARPMLALSTCG